MLKRGWAVVLHEEVRDPRQRVRNHECERKPPPALQRYGCNEQRPTRQGPRKVNCARAGLAVRAHVLGPEGCKVWFSGHASPRLPFAVGSFWFFALGSWPRERPGYGTKPKANPKRDSSTPQADAPQERSEGKSRPAPLGMTTGASVGWKLKPRKAGTKNCKQNSFGRPSLLGSDGLDVLAADANLDAERRA